jgi:predicted methyltransferase
LSSAFAIYLGSAFKVSRADLRLVSASGKARVQGALIDLAEGLAMNRRTLLGIAAGAALVLASPAAAAEDAALKAAIAGPQRTAQQLARDGARHPYETLTFWGLKPGSTVVEVSPGSGYWTEILAPYAKATGGTYVAGVADLSNPKISEGAKKGRADFEARFADPAKYGKPQFANFGAQSGPLGAPASADLVITCRNVHNWTGQPGMADKVFADFFAVLKPGGVLAVEDHRADPRSEKDAGADGYLNTATVIAIAEKAGFKLDAQSEINANPKDTKDHPFGVWTLPPTRRSAPAGQPADPSFDRTKYEAIGESDRMTLRFRKPA